MSILAGKAVWLVGLVLLCVGLVVGLGLGSTIDDADAAKKKELKTLWAVVNTDGSALRAKGVTTTTLKADDPGNYIIDFNRDVSKCASTATIEGGLAGEISTFKNASDPNGVRVVTYNSQASFENKPFTLLVNC